MTRDKQRITDYLEHILEAIDRINRYTAEMTKNDFLCNLLVQDAVIRNFEIIGEASHNIEIHHPEFASAHPYSQKRSSATLRVDQVSKRQLGLKQLSRQRTQTKDPTTPVSSTHHPHRHPVKQQRARWWGNRW